MTICLVTHAFAPPVSWSLFHIEPGRCRSCSLQPSVLIQPEILPAHVQKAAAAYAITEQRVVNPQLHHMSPLPSSMHGRLLMTLASQDGCRHLHLLLHRLTYRRLRWPRQLHATHCHGIACRAHAVLPAAHRPHGNAVHGPSSRRAGLCSSCCSLRHRHGERKVHLIADC